MILSWLSIGLAGYFLLAFTGVADKFFVSKVVRQPVAYAFYTAMSGPFSLLLLPFGGQLLSPFEFLVALLAGASFIIGIYFSYTAIAQTSVSRVVPIQAALVPLFSFSLAYFILGERLTFLQTSGFFFLVSGALLISFRFESGRWTSKAFVHAAASGLFFALASVLTKYTFDHSNFISGMVWTRIGFLLPVLPILAFKRNRIAIFNAPREAGAKKVALYYTSRATGTAGGFLQSYAVSLGSVSVVNALQGVQFVFLLILTGFLSVYYPKILKERIDINSLALKITAISLISCGLYLITK